MESSSSENPKRQRINPAVVEDEDDEKQQEIEENEPNQSGQLEAGPEAIGNDEIPIVIENPEEMGDDLSDLEDIFSRRKRCMPKKTKLTSR